VLSCPHDRSGRQRFRIYVFEHSDGTLYVGSTAKSVAERLREHRESRPGRGWKYRRDLSPPTVCATRERAEGIEKRTAERLRRRGYDVEQG
jgi:predicted GIY-YIG superfamily endonuclease